MSKRMCIRPGTGGFGLKNLTRAALAAVLAMVIAGLPNASAQAKPQYVSIAVDGMTGEIVQSTSPDTKVHPASLTKIMTLYVLFEELEAGRVSLDSRFKISSHASAQAPSKLGLKPGSTIRVHDAILALVTKSANDIAVAVGENISGSENKFARRMTETAQRLGMKNTVYRNASGLPNNEQITTARDQATLGRTIQIRFPSYYKYFSTRSFSYGGRRYSNHNRLLGKVEGVHGIKTGYIRAFGFNLVSAASRGDRHVVAVIIGARSGKSRNIAMARLLDDAFKRVKPHRANQLIAQTEIPMPRRNPMPMAARRANQPAVVQMASAQQPASAPLPAQTAKEPLVLVPNGRGGFKVAQASMAAPAPEPQPVAYQPAPQPVVEQAPLQVASAAPIPSAPIGSADAPQTTAALPHITIIKPARVVPAGSSISMAAEQTAPIQVTAPAPAPRPVAAAAPAPLPVRKTITEGDYAIQIGAVPDEKAAHKLIALAQLRAGELLAGRAPFTQTVDKDGATLWRARFAGFNQTGAKSACEVLQSKNFGCFPVRAN